MKVHMFRLDKRCWENKELFLLSPFPKSSIHNKRNVVEIIVIQILSFLRVLLLRLGYFLLIK